MMAYQVIYTKSAARDVKKLDRVVKKKIKKRIETYSQTPLRYARKLLDSKIGSYRWRVGNHRIVFDVDGAKIVILRVRHRREVYR